MDQSRAMPAGQSVNETGAAPYIACLVPAYPVVGPVFSRRATASVRPGGEFAGRGYFLLALSGLHVLHISGKQSPSLGVLRQPIIKSADVRINRG